MDYKETAKGKPAGTILGYTPELGFHYEEPVTPENIHTMSPEVQEAYRKGLEIAAKLKAEEEQRKKEEQYQK